MCYKTRQSSERIKQMKQNLLSMVQRILESRDAQEINSIQDTREAMQVANIVKETYEHLMYVRDIKAKNNLLTLHSMSDLKHPTYLQFKDDIAQVDMIKYFNKDSGRYTDLQYLKPEEFINRSFMLNPREPYVVMVKDYTDVMLYVRNDKGPQFWTSFDDNHIVLDSWDSSVEDTIEEENTVSYGVKIPQFILEDDFVPDLAPQHFPLLLSKSKVMAAMELDREYDQMEDDRARKQLMTVNDHSKRLLGQDSTLWQNRKLSGRHTH